MILLSLMCWKCWCRMEPTYMLVPRTRRHHMVSVCFHSVVISSFCCYLFFITPCLWYLKSGIWQKLMWCHFPWSTNLLAWLQEKVEDCLCENIVIFLFSDIGMSKILYCTIWYCTVTQITIRPVVLDKFQYEHCSLHCPCCFPLSVIRGVRIFHMESGMMVLLSDSTYHCSVSAIVSNK